MDYCQKPPGGIVLRPCIISFHTAVSICLSAYFMMRADTNSPRPASFSLATKTITCASKAVGCVVLRIQSVWDTCNIPPISCRRSLVFTIARSALSRFKEGISLPTILHATVNTCTKGCEGLLTDQSCDPALVDTCRSCPHDSCAPATLQSSRKETCIFR